MTLTSHIDQIPRCWLNNEAGLAAALRDTAEERPRARVAMLYIHGLNDYFFQSHVSDYVRTLGIDFFAIDLHGFGRSTRDEASRNFALSLREYGNDLATATAVIKRELQYDELIIMAHSTGGLIASLWAHSATGRTTVDGLILNSPWFDLHRPWFERTVGTAVVGMVGDVISEYVLDNEESNYVRMLHRDIAGQWDFNLEWKREHSSPMRTGFFKAVREGHARIAQGLDLECPVLVCTSSKTAQPTDDLATKRSCDVVLDVEQIARRAPLLGEHVEVVQVAGAVHDLALSEPGPRDAYLEAVTSWLATHGFIEPHTLLERSRFAQAI